MSVAIKFDEESDTYEFRSILHDYTSAIFEIEDVTGKRQIFKVTIEPVPTEFLVNVYNLAFGPPNERGGIEDGIGVSHRHPGKVYSTVIFLAFMFLKEKPNASIGLDGSNLARAVRYHQIFLNNRDALQEYFVTLGADYFVRFDRRSEDLERDSDGNPDWKLRPEPFNYLRSSKKIYSYYLFRLTKEHASS